MAPTGWHEYRFGTGEVTDLGPEIDLASANQAGVVAWDGEASVLVIRRDDSTDIVPVVGDLASPGGWNATPSLDRLVYWSDAGVGAWSQGHSPFFMPNAAFVMDDSFAWVAIGANDTGELVTVDLETATVQPLDGGCFYFAWNDEVRVLSFQAGCSAAGACDGSRLDAWNPATREVRTLADTDAPLYRWWPLLEGRVLTVTGNASANELLRVTLVDPATGVTLPLGTIGDPPAGLRFSGERVLVLDEGEVLDGSATLLVVDLADLSVRIVGTDVESSSVVTVPSDVVQRPSTFVGVVWKQTTGPGDLWKASLDQASPPMRVERGPANQLDRRNTTDGFAFYSLPDDHPHAGVWAIPLPR